MRVIIFTVKAILTITQIISIVSQGTEDIEGRQEIVVIDGRG